MTTVIRKRSSLFHLKTRMDQPSFVAFCAKPISNVILSCWAPEVCIALGKRVPFSVLARLSFVFIFVIDWPLKCLAANSFSVTIILGRRFLNKSSNGLKIRRQTFRFTSKIDGLSKGIEVNEVICVCAVKCTGLKIFLWTSSVTPRPRSHEMGKQAIYSSLFVTMCTNIATVLQCFHPMQLNAPARWNFRVNVFISFPWNVNPWSL